MVIKENQSSGVSNSSITVVKPNKTKHKIAKVEDFYVTTDSVVAKATIITDKKAHFLEVDWGDGEKSNINTKFASYHKLSAFDGTDSLQPGTYEFYHKYEVTYNQSGIPEKSYPTAKDYFVTLRAFDTNGGFDFRLKNITIEPEYRINFYGLYVGLKNQCDNGRSPNEFTVQQFVEGEIVNEWDWHPSDNFFFQHPTHQLEGSQLSQTFKDTGINSPWRMGNVAFNFTEHDDIYDDTGFLFYDTLLSTYLSEMKESASGRIEDEIVIGDANPLWRSSCKLSYAVDWEIRLFVPLPTSNELIYSPSP